MSRQWMRRALLALAPAAALFLAGCGSGTIESQLEPTRVFAFGTGFSDLGQVGNRQTVNDNTINIWTQEAAASFTYLMGPVVTAGGTDYATRNARIVATPDAAGNAATPTVAKQIDTFLAGTTPTATDLVFIEGGITDIIAEVGKLNAGTQTSAQTLANVQQAGRDLAAQTRRLVQAGASHVVVVGTIDLSRTPWGITTGQGALLTDLSTKFNTELLTSIVDLGASVLYVDAAFQFNLMSSNPGIFGLNNSTDVACTSVDPGPGIGIGAGKVNAALCTPATIVAGINYNLYMWADPVYPTPFVQRYFGDYAYQRIRSRW
ncbi:SGNH/GDSL hydrolase family protein [Caenimonas aquaedulcis]|uniref:SGNH/GDSL hydrolase family protein n=1 Tax=Caenimonas aquaedulcis TaxID=2793270 RepID=A0A931H551_9BURK|nr:SGNH/GDSL hydrolase family protein [Caenimonas aquaedulcis]MBG9388824.1 SGNH/GDSL hydrolase family protein [Caenimonas aquaedulcis]